MEFRTVINYMVDDVTKERIVKLAESTHRTPGRVLDWLVSEAWERIQKVEQGKKSVEEALSDCQEEALVADCEASEKMFDE